MIIQLTSTQLEEFRAYLDQQEAKLADALLLAVPPHPGSSLHLHGSGHIRLAQSLHTMTARVQELNETSKEEWRGALACTSKALKEYVGVLQGAGQELIDQLKLPDFFGWNKELYEVVYAFKELLTHRIEDLIWVYQRLEELFFIYRTHCQKRKNLWVHLGKFLGPFNTMLDRQILVQLKALKTRISAAFNQFNAQFKALMFFSTKEKEREGQIRRYPIFKEFSSDRKTFFLKLFRMLGIWKDNGKNGELKEQEITAAISQFAKSGLVTAHFKEYLRTISQRLFNLSSAWQERHDITLLTGVRELDEELASLAQTVSSYKEVLLKTDPKKPRLPIISWFVVPKRRKTRDLSQLIEEIEMIQKWIAHLIATIEKGPPENHFFQKEALKREMDALLHEMGQPLFSRDMLQLKAETLIELVDKADEIGGSMGDVHGMITDLFLKALRYDSKYQVLHDYRHFEELYAMHRGFMPSLLDSNHEKRMRLFQHIVHHVEYWMTKHAIREHVEELEIDEVSIQEALQQLLAAIQRKEVPQDNKWESYFQMLLEYRYLFSRFFHRLRSFNADGKVIRTQFYFLDQYLDAIEKQLRLG